MKIKKEFSKHRDIPAILVLVLFVAFLFGFGYFSGGTPQKTYADVANPAGPPVAVTGGGGSCPEGYYFSGGECKGSNSASFTGHIVPKKCHVDLQVNGVNAVTIKNKPQTKGDDFTVTWNGIDYFDGMFKTQGDWEDSDNKKPDGPSHHKGFTVGVISSKTTYTYTLFGENVKGVRTCQDTVTVSVLPNKYFTLQASPDPVKLAELQEVWQK